MVSDVSRTADAAVGCLGSDPAHGELVDELLHPLPLGIVFGQAMDGLVDTTVLVMIEGALTQADDAVSG